jgi:hypothetical protein
VNFFRLFAHGKEFDVDAFLATTTLRPDYVWRRGDRRRGYEDIAGLPGHPTSGVEFVLGGGRKILYPEQEEIAVAFIAANRDGLRALGEFPGADHYILMFHYEAEFDRDRESIGGTVWASRRLMWHALDIGCHVDFALTLRRVGGEDEPAVDDAIE